jgi:GT2 family glycosyltransferase
MADTLPEVLVVMPTLGKRLDTLEESLNSVTSQVGVAPRLAVVVPKSATRAREIAERVNATVVDDPGNGLSAAVNAGVAARKDETYYAWLNDDDFFAPGALRLLVSLLEASPGASVAYGACVYIDDLGRKIGVSRAGDTASRILGWGPDLVPQPSALHRVDAVLAAGQYDEDLRFAMDLDMLLRLRRIGPFVSTKEIVSSFRWHAESLTVANRKHSLAESEAVKHRYLSPRARRVAPLWDIPVRLATHLAARQVSRRARKLAAVEVRA